MNPSANSDAARAAAFVDFIADRTATEKMKWSLGHATLNLEFPRMWDLNLLRIEHDDRTMTAAEVAAETDEVLGRFELRHRKVTADAVAGSRLARGFRSIDWNVTRLVWMSLQGPAPNPGPVEVREVTFDELEDVWTSLQVEEHDMGPEESDMVFRAIRDVVAPAANIRLFCGMIDGDIGGWCEYHRGEGIGQVENVTTRKAAQGRGVARSVIAKALEASMADGNDLDFLIADDDDWPKELYARLGYQPFAYSYEFLLKPPSNPRRS